MTRLIFATPVSPGESERETVLLARSIYAHGGALGESTVWALVPRDIEALSGAAQQTLRTLGVTLIPFPMDEAALRFPFAIKAYAAAAAEEFARSRVDILAWLDSDTLIVQEPRGLLLESDKALACCPIHHLRIGPRYDAPLDPFWRLVYDVCGVPDDRTFLMHTAVDGDRIRLHLNAGLLAVRPECGLLAAWRDNFGRCYHLPVFEQFYQQDVLYRIFMHQAILTGTVLAHVASDEIEVLPATYNYPLHLHAHFPTGRAAACLNDLVTCQYDGWDFFQRPGWQGTLPIHEPLQRWLVAQATRGVADFTTGRH